MVIFTDPKTVYLSLMNKSPLPQWHRIIDEKNDGLIDQLIDKQCVFYSPIVFKPQEGKRLTVMYLTAAFRMFSEAAHFRYVKELVDGQTAMLEFEAEIEGIQVNGIDLITWNDEGLITEFKVMIRPLKAIDLVKQKMLDLLSQMGTFQKLKLKGGVFWDKLKS